MTSSTRPRHAKKEVRELADWLEDHGWKFTRTDSKDHTVWTWPKTGERLTLPGTPHGTLWLRNIRISALKIMGQHTVTKRRPKPYVATPPHAGLVITKAHERQILEWIEECRKELTQAAAVNGNESARRWFDLFAFRLRQIIGD